MRIRFLILLLLVACASKPPAKELDAKGATTPGVRGYSSFGGDSPVGVIPDAVLHDAQRNKDLHMNIEYPTKAGTYPVIVLSHGLGGSQRGYVGLSAQWTSYGFIVIKPSHADSGTVKTIADARAQWEKQTAEDARNRVRDITFILDSIGELETKYPELQKKIDREKIGVGGHSYGALTALQVGGLRTFAGGQATSYADPRVKALLVMSPPGTREARGITRESFSAINIPVMYMTGTADRGAGDDETPEWRHEAFEYSSAGEKWFISLTEGRHMTFTGRFMEITDQERRDRTERADDPTVEDPRGPEDPRRPDEPRQRQQRSRSRGSALSAYDRDRNLFNVIKGVSTAYWDAYLRNEQAAKDYLGKLSTRSDMTVEKK